ADRRRVAGEPMRPEGRDDAPEVGFFATRTPKRPNPIGIACPRLIGREGSKLHVTGLDAWDGTPVLDIKSYYPRDEQRPDATVPEWLTTLWRQHDAERAPNPAVSVGPAMPLPGAVVARHQTAKGEVEFRYPLPTDAPSALTFVNALSAERTFVLFQGEQMTLAQERAWIDERLASLAAGKGIPLFAFAGDRYIGSAVIELGTLVASHIGYFGIGLASEWRDQGIGTALMQAVIDEAERHLAGMRMIQLDVFATNERGIHLYRKLGFTEYARLPGAVHHRGDYVDMISMYRPVRSQNST
ncbi:MAG TPA: TrmO family methyltransferase, partial [Thermomicrobiales bacterium]|nr:TrmO family methyltransferase [Thermomicrobiales bacterium]